MHNGLNAPAKCSTPIRPGSQLCRPASDQLPDAGTAVPGVEWLISFAFSRYVDSMIISSNNLQLDNRYVNIKYLFCYSLFWYDFPNSTIPMVKLFHKKGKPKAFIVRKL